MLQDRKIIEIGFFISFPFEWIFIQISFDSEQKKMVPQFGISQFSPKYQKNAVIYDLTFVE